jgi:hypothetical protein
MVAADLARLGILILVVGSILTVLIRITIGIRVPPRLMAAGSFVTLALAVVVALVLPNLSRSAYHGFGVSLTATPACYFACLAALGWVALEVAASGTRPSVPRLGPRREPSRSLGEAS